jgi:tetratricopeptide (TPR) repeat protein
MRARVAVVSLLLVAALAVAGPAAADYQAGIAAYAQGDFTTAARELAAVVEGHDTDPRYAGAFYMLGMARSRLHQDKQAVANLERAVELDRGNASYALGLGQALLSGNQPERACTILKSIDLTALEPERRTPYALLLATAALRSDHAEVAVEVLEARLAASPGEAVLERALGVTFQRLGRNEEAFAAFAAAFTANPTDLESGRAAVRIGLGQAASAADKGARARLYRRTAEVAGRLAESLPGSETAMLAGEAALGARDFAAALGWFKKVDEATPGDPVVLTYLGQTLGFLDRYDEALAAYQRALAASPDAELRRRVWDRIGDVHAGRLELGDAIKAYQKAGNAKRAAEVGRLRDDVGEAIERRDRLASEVAKLARTAVQLDALGEHDGAAKLRERIALTKREINKIERNLAEVRAALAPSSE